MKQIDYKVTGQEISKIRDWYYETLCEKTEGGSFNKNYPAGKLLKLSKKNGNWKYSKIFRFLFKNVDLLFTGTPHQLEAFHTKFHNFIQDNNLGNLIKEPDYTNLVSSVFIVPYETFRNGGRKIIYDWFNKLKIDTCPYCNRNWITKTLDSENAKQKLYFDIDHYFPKAHFPYFALSFYNLIPSCTICNQRIKKNDKLSLDDYLHPYIDDFDSIVKFNIPIKSTDVFFTKKKEIKLELIGRTGRSKINIDRAIDAYKGFNLENLYNTHIDYVRELMQKDIVYSQSYIVSLFEEYGKKKKVFESKEDMMKMLFGNYVLPENIHKRPLAKLTKDIIEDFSINKD